MKTTPKTSVGRAKIARRVFLSPKTVFLFTPSSSHPPSSSARRHAPSDLSSTAMSRGVRPSASFAPNTAPFSTSLRIATRFPRTTAQCSGVSPASSCTVGLAPCLNSRSTLSASPWYAAHISAVCPCASRESTPTGWCSRYSSGMMLLLCVTRWRALYPCESAMVGSAPCAMRSWRT
ncbi:hypothetical protein B0H14DRAFT_2844194 [Mycena olivaceomarginata]|nr:hypothetical protein B0H14DRAFT_2844194 [Mycena olivaceomarginata]